MESDTQLLDRLNRLSLTRSFTPQIDIDWNAVTTDEDYEVLYHAWSLFEGTGYDAHLDKAGRVKYVKYQQMNLMLLTGNLERHVLAALAELYDLDSSEPFAEYVGHFIKEEIYHHMMFRRAADLIHASMPDSAPLPVWRIDRVIRWMFWMLSWLPGRRLRLSATFSILQFVERVTLFAHQMVQSRLPRRNGLVNQVWAFHARDEARHVAFDTLILERNKPMWGLRWLPRCIAMTCCVAMSLLINANELWIGRQVNIRASVFRLPWLMRNTHAPFKRRMIGLLWGLGESGGWEAPSAEEVQP